MKYFAGLDVSVKETSICIADEAGKICSECKAPSFPEDLVGALNNPNGDLNALAWKRCPKDSTRRWMQLREQVAPHEGFPASAGEQE